MILVLVVVVKSIKVVTAQMLKTKNILIAALFLMLSHYVKAQEPGSVTEVKDPLIDSLIKKRIELTKGVSQYGTPLVIKGYRVQIFFGPNRKEAYDAQAKFKTLYPEYSTYISYTQPNYRVKVGDFRLKMEAEQLMSSIRPIFPTLFIFNEDINPEKVDQ